jgi:molybdopterin-guanine dinucleotide biosynthesis protein A
VTIAAVILAGGMSRRMGGGDKALHRLAGRPILDHVIARIRPQVDVTVLNANGDPARFAAWDLPVIQDSIAGFPGPLAGIHTGMEWAAKNFPGITDILSIPADLPFLPPNLAAELEKARTAKGADIAIASSGGQIHPTVALWPVRLAAALGQAIVVEDIRKVTAFANRYTLAVAEFPVDGVDPFHNINSPDDLAQAETLAALSVRKS